MALDAKFTNKIFLNFLVLKLLKQIDIFDEDNLVLIFKNLKTTHKKFNFDDPQKIIDFLKRWKAESLQFKEYDI